MKHNIPKFDKDHVRYVHDQDETVIGFDIAMGSYQPQLLRLADLLILTLKVLFTIVLFIRSTK